MGPSKKREDISNGKEGRRRGGVRAGRFPGEQVGFFLLQGASACGVWKKKTPWHAKKTKWEKNTFRSVEEKGGKEKEAATGSMKQGRRSRGGLFPRLRSKKKSHTWSPNEKEGETMAAGGVGKDRRASLAASPAVMNARRNDRAKGKREEAQAKKLAERGTRSR